MKKPPRSRMSSEERRTQILDKARQLAVSEGFYQVTIDRVASECGITRTLVYQQFGTLASLLVTMVDREVVCASKGLADAMLQTPAGKQNKFVYTLAGLLKAVQEAPETWKMLLMPSEGGPPALYERINQALEFTYEFLGSGLEDLKDKSASLTEIDHDLTVRLMHVVGDELVKLHLQDPITYPTDRLLKQAEWASKTLFRFD